MSALWSTIIGLAGGIALSILFWFLTTHLIVPRVRFSDRISKRFAPDGTPSYEIRVINRSRFRGVIDLSTSSVVRCDGLTMFQHSTRVPALLFCIPTTFTNIVKLRPRDGFRVIRLDLDGAFADASTHYRRAFRLDVFDPAATGPLEYVLTRGDDAYLRVEVLGNDEWTGVRKYFCSPKYTMADIVHGEFDGMVLRPIVVPVEASGQLT